MDWSPSIWRMSKKMSTSRGERERITGDKIEKKKTKAKLVFKDTSECGFQKKIISHHGCSMLLHRTEYHPLTLTQMYHVSRAVKMRKVPLW